MDDIVALVHLPGFPWHLEDLMPQRSAASTAAALRRADQRGIVFDFGTPETLAAVEHDLEVVDHLLHNEQLALDVARLAVTRILETARPKLVVLHVERRKDVFPAREFARVFRSEAGPCPVVLSGPYAQAYGSLILELDSNVDAICADDPEITIPKLAQAASNRSAWKHVPNLIFRRRKGVFRTSRQLEATLDRLPAPDYSAAVYPAVQAGQKLFLFEVEQTRGGHPAQLGPVAPWSVSPLRRKAPSLIAKEIDAVRQACNGTNAFHIKSDGDDHDAMQHLAYELRGRDRMVYYSRLCSMQLFDGVTPEGLRASGCRVVSFDVPTGSQRLLDDFYGANIGISQVERNLHRCQHAQLRSVLNLTYPCPEDDRHTRAETIRLISRTMPDAVNIAPPELLPESTWRDWQQTYGFVVDEKDYRRWAGGERGTSAWAAHGFQVPYEMSGHTVDGARRSFCSLHRDVAELRTPIGRTPREDLLAWLLDLQQCPAEFEVIQQSVADESRTLAALVDAFNHRVCLPDNTVVFFPFVPELHAVGN